MHSSPMLWSCLQVYALFYHRPTTLWLWFYTWLFGFLELLGITAG